MKILTIVLLVVVLPFQVSSAAACTGVFASDEKTVLLGNNEDFFNVVTSIWILPPEKGKLGRIYFGFAGVAAIPMGGMNEKGLFFDYFMIPAVELNDNQEKQHYKGNLFTRIMEECPSVDRALGILDKFNLDFLNGVQVFLADRQGDWAVVEADAVLRGRGGFKVVTNFSQSKTSPENAACERYRIARDMIGKQAEVSKDFVRRVMAAVHYENQPFRGGVINTLYTNIYDLSRGIIYLYQFHDYANEVVIDLEEEFKKGRREYEIHTMFPETLTMRHHLGEARRNNAWEVINKITGRGK